MAYGSLVYGSGAYGAPSQSFAPVAGTVVAAAQTVVTVVAAAAVAQRVAVKAQVVR